MESPAAADFIIQARSLGYNVFEGTFFPYNLNIIGWRNKKARPNYFDDTLAIYWKSANGWNKKSWPITTYPGIPWLLNPMLIEGTAIMVPGQYEGAYSLGKYHGVVSLLETKPVKVFRDNNRDDKFGMNIEEGLFGVHIHRAGVWSKLVGTSSAGCQVFQKRDDFSQFITICEKASRYWGNHFTYTLMEI